MPVQRDATRPRGPGWPPTSLQNCGNSGFLSTWIPQSRSRCLSSKAETASSSSSAAVVDAVKCAVAWQNRNSDSEFERDLRFRIGVNLGDVIFEDGDIYGNGANVAARLEGPAEPGGIWREPSGESRFEGYLGNVGSTMRSRHLGPSYRPWHSSGCHPSSAVHPRSRSTFSSIEPLLPTCKLFSCESDGSGYKIRPGSPHLREVRP